MAGFQSTRPVWGATSCPCPNWRPCWTFQSTRPVWGATITAVDFRGIAKNISIHAPRVGRDGTCWRPSRTWWNFNPRAPCGARHMAVELRTPSYDISIHAPRVGRDGGGYLITIYIFRFQSTRPVWGATVNMIVEYRSDLFQSTRPVWGATAADVLEVRSLFLFQSTRPVWGATAGTDGNGFAAGISIHAPRVGRDDLEDGLQDLIDISIHAPRVGRDGHSGRDRHGELLFQSTRPVWGATFLRLQVFAGGAISIHAPRVGRDRATRSCRLLRRHFNPRAPCGARPATSFPIRMYKNFNPRAPCGARPTSS